MRPDRALAGKNEILKAQSGIGALQQFRVIRDHLTQNA